jgi:16S rRNA (adenine1518-N6/adenine1519-N6)-dimethyltransferase
MTGKEIKEALDRFNVLPSKQMGQNFLIDPNMARWIVSQLELAENDTVVEVGPGTGALTEHIVGVAKRVILIEFDARLAAFLKDRFAGEASVEVHHADGARFDGRQLFPHRPLKFLGNLPYSCGGAILKNLLSRPHPFQRAVIMLQKEVIDRMVASPATGDYGRLSVMLQWRYAMENVLFVPPESFDPPPRVDSAVVRMVPHAEPAALSLPLLEELGLTEGLTDAEELGLIVGEALGLLDGDTLPLLDGDTLPLLEGDMLGLLEGDMLGLLDGETLGLVDEEELGLTVTDTLVLGLELGLPLRL